MVGGRSIAATGDLLARNAVRCAGVAGVANGSSATCPARPCRRSAGSGRRSAAGAGAEGTQPAARADDVYDLTRQLRDAAIALVWTGRCGDRQSGGQSWSLGDRGADRLLCQYTGVAGGVVRLADVGAVTGVGEGACAASTDASGHPVRAGGGISAAAAQPGACTVVPGDVRLAEHTAGCVESWRTRCQWSGCGADERAVRSIAVLGRKQGWDRRQSDLCHRVVRACDAGAMDRSLAAFVGGDGGRRR